MQLFGYRKKIQALSLLGTDFSELESGRFSGIEATVLRLSSDKSQVI